MPTVCFDADPVQPAAEDGDAPLGLSEKTVKNLANAFEKLQVSRRSQAAVLFARAQSRFPATPAYRMAHDTARAS